MPKMKIILLLLVLISSQLILASTSKFHFVKIIDGTPYAIINNSVVKSNLLKALIKPYYKKDVGIPYQITIDSTNVEIIKHINLDFWDPHSGINCLTLTGEPDHLKAILGYAIGDKLVIQHIKENGVGSQKVIIVEKILLYANRDQIFILLKCKPEDNDHDWLNLKNNHRNYIISSEYHPWPKDFLKSPADTLIPDFIHQKVNVIADNLIPEHYKYPEKSVSLTPLSYYKDGTLHNFYCAAIKIDQIGKGSLMGKYFLFDNNGNIIQRIDDRMITRIIGISDVNRDGFQELTVFSGSSYGGGLLFLNFDPIYHANKPASYLLKVKSNLTTVWD